jgi:formylglycine-generating enzyme
LVFHKDLLMPPSTADLRRFLIDAFGDEDLKSLCFDYFRDVYDDFTAGMTKGQMIQLLFERCVRRDALANLEAALRAERPDQYEKRFGAPEPAGVPTERIPAGRNPRQVFVSHAHQDANFAHRLAADLRSAGWRAWIAPDSILPGERWVEAISRGLDGSGVFVLVLTRAAVRSSWVRKETYDAIDLQVRGEIRFIPLDLESCGVPTMWGTYQRVSFRSRYEDGLGALLNRLSERSAADSTSRAVEAVQPPAPAIGVPAVVRAKPARPPVEFDWVIIPAGEFLMGSDKTKDALAFDDETPQHTLYVPEYRIARVPVTVAQFAAFMEANPSYRTTAEERGTAWKWNWKWNWTGARWKEMEIKGADWAHPSGPGSDVRAKQDHPVTCVSWHDAVAFCRWAGVRLPTEAEWEKAARGTDGRIWPWGDREPNSGLCNFDMTLGDTTPVGRYPVGKSPYGLLDVAGNVLEWTNSLWGTDAIKPEFGYPYDAMDGRENLSVPDVVRRVERGGSFANGLQWVRCAFRGGPTPDYRSDNVGFRVVSPGF